MDIFYLVVKILICCTAASQPFSAFQRPFKILIHGTRNICIYSSILVASLGMQHAFNYPNNASHTKRNRSVFSFSLNRNSEKSYSFVPVTRFL